MEKKKLRKVQSGLFRIIFSRTGLVLVMILLQIGLFVVSMSRLQAVFTSDQWFLSHTRYYRADLYY